MITPHTPDELDPDLAVDVGAFEAFAEAVVAAVLAPALDSAAAGAAEGAAEVGESGTVVAGEGADALYTLPDGSMSFSGYGPDGTSYSFDVG